MKFRHSGVLLLLITLFCFSCTSYKNVPYFQDLKADSVTTEQIKNYSPLIIQPGDLLAIHVNSLNHEADAMINYNLERPNGNTTINIDRPDENAVSGYLVDKNGNILLPMVGEVKVAGLETKAAALTLQTRLAEFMTNPVVNLRIQNFKVSILGDVKSPGVFYSLNERFSIADALGMAGDLNTTGLRKVLLIREINGERKYISLDLTSKDVFKSPYFYLKNNDVIYITPNKERVAASDSAYQKASIVISALSILAILLTRK